MKFPDVISPDNKVYKIEHLTNFAKEHKLDPSALSRLLKKKAKTHKGWKLANE